MYIKYVLPIYLPYTSQDYEEDSMRILGKPVER